MKEIIKLIQSEIDYHKRHNEPSNQGEQCHNDGFIKGLQQALYVVQKYLDSKRDNQHDH